MMSKLIPLEFLFLCIVFPSIIIFNVWGSMMPAFLWAATVYCFLIVKFQHPCLLKNIWKFDQINKANLKPILIRWVFASLAMVVIVHLYSPDKAFMLVKERPQILFAFVFIYPLLSALPQEFIFCSFFFERYDAIFKSERAKIIASTIVFAYAHVLYLNPISPVLSLFAGYIFAKTYSDTRSLALVSLEHGLYGITLFMSGLGYYFYSGAVAVP